MNAKVADRQLMRLRTAKNKGVILKLSHQHSQSRKQQEEQCAIIAKEEEQIIKSQTEERNKTGVSNAPKVAVVIWKMTTIVQSETVMNKSLMNFPEVLKEMEQQHILATNGTTTKLTNFQTMSIVNQTISQTRFNMQGYLNTSMQHRVGVS
jgi:hypothetical protein